MDVCRKMATHDSHIFTDCASFLCYDVTYNVPSDTLSSISLVNLLKDTHRFLSNAILLVILLFCLMTTSTIDINVFRIIRRHQQQVQAHEPRQNTAQPDIDLAKYAKSVFSILYILGVFHISYLPFILFISLSFYYNHSDLEMTFIISLMILFVSSALNPLICLWRMNEIRNGAKQLLRRLLCKEP